MVVCAVLVGPMRAALAQDGTEEPPQPGGAHTNDDNVDGADDPDTTAPPGTPQIEISILDPDGTFRSWEEDVTDLRDPQRTRRMRIYVIPHRFRARHVTDDPALAFEMSGDRLVVWQQFSFDATQPTLPGQTADTPTVEFYAAGNVRLEFAKRDSIRAEEAFFSLSEQVGLMFDARGQFSASRGSFYIAAREFRVYSANAVEGEDAQFAITPFAEPHIAIVSKRVRVITKGPNRILDITGNRVSLHGSNVLPFPTFQINTGRPSWLVALDFAQSDRRGISLNSNLDLIMLVTELFGYDPYGTVDSRTVFAGADVHTERGIAVHGDWLYGGQGAQIPQIIATDRFDPRQGWVWVPARPGAFRGKLELWYIDDSGDDSQFGIDQGLFPPDETDRFRFRYFHQHDLFELARLTGQFVWLSDKNVLREWFIDEFEGQVNQTTFLEFSRLGPVWGIRARVRGQINGFDAIVEYKPRVTGYAFPIRLATVPGLNLPIFLDGQLDFANMTAEAATGSGISADSDTRIDVQAGITIPLNLGFVAVAFDARVQGTWYGLNFADNIDSLLEVDRFAYQVGGHIYTNIWNSWDAASDFFDITALRHIVTPEIRVRHVFGPDWFHGFTEATVPQFDEIDDVSAGTEILLTLRNLLQAKRQGKTINFLDIVLELPMYPNPDRDNNGNVFGPFTGTMQFNPAKWLTVNADARIDLNAGNVERYGIEGVFTIEELLRLSVSHRVVRNESILTGFSARWSVSRAYDLEAALRYDFDNDDLYDLGFTVQRNFPDFSLAFTLRFDQTRDDTTVLVTFIPAKFWATRPLQLFETSAPQ